MWSLRGGWSAGITASITTLDAQALRERTPDLLKIDVEGAELDVLLGGHDLSTQRRPLVIMELASDAPLQEMEHVLPGYELRRLGAGHWLAQPLQGAD